MASLEGSGVASRRGFFAGGGSAVVEKRRRAKCGRRRGGENVVRIRLEIVSPSHHMLRALQRLSHAAERPGVWSPLGGVSAARVGAARGSLQAAAQVFSATPASGIGTPRCFTTTPVSAVAPPRKTSEEVHGKIDIDSVSSKAMRRTLQRKQQAEGALKPLPEEAQQQQQDAAQQQWLAQQAQEQQQQWSGQQTMSFGQLLKHNLVMGFGECAEAAGEREEPRRGKGACRHHPQPQSHFPCLVSPRSLFPLQV